MRAFFALDIDPAVRCAIEKWRDRTLRSSRGPAGQPAPRPVPAVNFHITLVFLGNLAPRQLERLSIEADRIETMKYVLRLDTPGYFPKPGIFWIGPGAIPAELFDLAAKLKKAGRKAGIKTSRKPFTPHLTLLRNCRARPPLPVSPAGFDIACDGFALFESTTSPKGVRYEIVRRWTA